MERSLKLVRSRSGRQLHGEYIQIQHMSPFYQASLVCGFKFRIWIQRPKRTILMYLPAFTEDTSISSLSPISQALAVKDGATSNLD